MSVFIFSIFALNLLLILIFFIFVVTFYKFQLILSLGVYSKFKVCMLYRIWNGHVDKDDEKLSCNHDYSHKGVRIFWRSSFMKWRGISLGSEFPKPGSLHFFPFSYIFYPKTQTQCCIPLEDECMTEELILHSDPNLKVFVSLCKLVLHFFFLSFISDKILVSFF